METHDADGSADPAGDDEGTERPRRAGRSAVVMGDVAALAGVSQMTVSRAINDRPGVRGGTRARVLDAMQELGYRPNLAARDAGYFVSVATVRHLDRRSIDEAADRLRAQAVDGTVVIARHTSAVDGLRALEILVDQVEGRPPRGSRLVIEPDLVLRESGSPPSPPAGPYAGR